MTQMLQAAPDAGRESAPARVPGPLRTLIVALSRSKTGFIGFWVFLIMVVGSFIAPIFVTPDKTANLDLIYRPPSAAHLLGTDSQGKDILEQILVGGRDIIIVGLSSALISTLIAITFGALAAYRRGWLDSLVVQATDFVLTIPQLVLLPVLSVYLRLNSVFLMAILLGLLSWPALLRAVRAQVLSLKEREYVEAASLVNLGTGTIIFREIVPNMASYLMIHFIQAMTGAVYALTGLYLLGLAPMSGSNWGIMLNEAWTRGAMLSVDSLSTIVSPLLAISVLQLSSIWLIRSLEEIINPRLREG